MLDIAKILKDRMGSSAKKVPTRELPNWLARLVALVKPEMRPMVPQLGKIRTATSEKAKRMLGWSPRSNEETIVSTAECLVRLGLLKQI
jgi:nucleoside-diphosphate-sugar epimerase